MVLVFEHRLHLQRFETGPPALRVRFWELQCSDADPDNLLERSQSCHVSFGLFEDFRVLVLRGRLSQLRKQIMTPQCIEMDHSLPFMIYIYIHITTDTRQTESAMLPSSIILAVQLQVSTTIQSKPLQLKTNLAFLSGSGHNPTIYIYICTSK